MAGSFSDRRLGSRYLDCAAMAGAQLANSPGLGMFRRSIAKAMAADDQGEPEEDHVVGEDRRSGASRGGAVRDQDADQAEIDPADAARQRDQPAQLPDQVAHQDHCDRRRYAERVEGRPEHGVVEEPVAEGAGEDAAIGGAQDASRLRGAANHRSPSRAEPALRSGGIGAGKRTRTRAQPRKGRNGHDYERGHGGREGSQPEGEVRPDQPDRERRPDHRDGDEVDPALDQEEGDRAAGDALPAHAPAV